MRVDRRLVWLHRYAGALAAAVLLLIAAGALVTSKDAGLSVPDWPLSYGSLNPPRWWQIENVRAEHGHRLIAGSVALLTLGLALFARRAEPRRWVRRLAWTAVAAVLLQALLGGLTVLFYLPTPVSVGHAALAEIFFCLVVTLAVVTAPAWRREPAPTAGLEPLRRAAIGTTALVFAQILLGAVMRHSGAGLAIPDFPLVFGRLVPPRFDFGIAVHYAHRLGALAVAAAVAWTLAQVLSRAPRHRGLKAAGLALAGLVTLQVGLGGAVILSGRAVVPNTLHVATGAAVLATSLTLSLAVARLAARRTAPRAVAAAAVAREVGA